MTRAILLLYDDVRQLVVPLGSQGIPPDLLEGVYGTLEETPIAQLALSEDRVVEVTGDLGRWVPERYARFTGVETLTCTPVSAAGRLLGVIFADRGGSRFELTDEERHSMWTLGKTAALAATVRIATSQQGRARLLQARIDLAREIHDRVVQRLFGVSLVLGSEHGLSEEARQRCADGDAGGARRPARGDLAAARAADARHRRDAARRARAARPPLQGPAARARLGGGRGGARGRRAARPVGARRGASQRPQARAPDERERARRPHRRHLRARGPQRRRAPGHARHRHGPAARRGGGAPARRARRVRPGGRLGVAGAARRARWARTTTE